MALLQLLHVHQQLTGQHRYACGAAAEREEGCVLFDTDSFISPLADYTILMVL